MTEHELNVDPVDAADVSLAYPMPWHADVARDRRRQILTEQEGVSVCEAERIVWADDASDLERRLAATVIGLSREMDRIGGAECGSLNPRCDDYAG